MSEKYVLIRYADGARSLLTKSYESGYNDIIKDLALIEFRQPNNFSEKDKAMLTKTAITILIKAEREGIKNSVKSDYDYFIEDDDDGLFDLVSYYYDEKTKESKQAMLAEIGQRLVRNYELRAARKINRDTATLVDVMTNGGQYLSNTFGDYFDES